MKGLDKEIVDLATDAAKTAHMLDHGWKILIASALALSVTLLMWLMGYPARTPVLISATVIASFQAYFALRVLIDASVFENWSSRWQEGSNPAADLAAFDARIGRNSPPASCLGEDLAIRIEGARRLLILQAVFATIQLLLLGITLWP